MVKNLLNNLKFILFGLVLILGASYVHADWSAPTEAPTGGNTQPPINVSSTAQVKDGGLAVNAFYAAAAAQFHQDVNLDSVADTSISSSDDHQIRLCADAITGKIEKCKDSNFVVFKYETKENSNNFITDSNGKPYTWIDSDLDFNVNGDHVYSEYWNTYGNTLFPIAHDGDVVTLTQTTSATNGVAGRLPSTATAKMIVLRDNDVIYCNVTDRTAADNGWAVNKFQFTAQTNHLYRVQVDTSDTSLYYNDAAQKWQSGCSFWD